jgi:hypothetical protein
MTARILVTLALGIVVVAAMITASTLIEFSTFDGFPDRVAQWRREASEARRAAAAAIEGRLEASRDIHNGTLTLKTYGYPMFNDPYPSMLKKHGIEIVPVAGCVVIPGEVAAWDAYNDAMTAEISRRYGPRFLAEMREKANVEMHRQQAEQKLAAAR